jgi:hypothetical protein
MRVTDPSRPTQEAFRPDASVLRGTVSLAQRAERRSDLGREELGHFPGGEVASSAGLVEVDEVGVGLLDPAARGREDLAGEHGDRDVTLGKDEIVPNAAVLLGPAGAMADSATCSWAAPW